MAKHLLLALSLGLVLTACSKSEQSHDDHSNGNTALTSISETKISVPTVQCGSCQANIETVLKKLEGVKSAEVDLETKTTLVSFDPQKIELAALENAIAMAGYDANSTKRDATAYAELDACCKLPGDR
ncbi:heavy-metal-associated domain-containing protein [bacterium]|nr:heavy-metal-associated domain-containing protein [bacterium]